MGAMKQLAIELLHEELHHEWLMEQAEEGGGVKTIDVIFDGPPGPVSGRFVEVEDTETGASIGVGTWVDLSDEGGTGLWALRIDLEKTLKERP